MPITREVTPDILGFAEREDIPYSEDPTLIKDHSVDFGQLIKGRPLGVFQPHDHESIIKIIQAANKYEFSITPRGKGRSQSGQAINSGGISLDMSQINSITILTESRFKCGAGASWRDLIKKTFATGLVPYVIPLNLDLSIGGTLSAGGFGATSFKHGPAIAHVTEIEVVTGTGDFVACSPKMRPDIFNAILAGQGRCGVLVSATLKLRAYQDNTKTYYLLYNSLTQLLEDQKYLSSLASVDYVEGFCTSIIHGLKLTSEGRKPLIHWQYGLHVSFEYTSGIDITSMTQKTLSTLNFQDLLHEETTTTDEYLSRYDARFQRMKMMNHWEKPHPWFECFIPLQKAPKLISKFLDILPPYLGDGHRIIYFSKVETTPLFMHSESDQVVAFAILPTAIEEDNLSGALDVIETLNRLLYENGGKRYISGWMGEMDNHRWKQHFEHQYDYWHNLKSELDPKSIFKSCLFNEKTGC